MSENTKSVGITNLKTAITFSTVVVAKFASLDEDGNGKVDMGEALSALTSIAIKTPSLVSAIPHLKAELKDCTTEEREELVKWFAQEFDLPPQKDRIERIIETSVDALSVIYKKFQEIKELLASA